MPTLLTEVTEFQCVCCGTAALVRQVESLSCLGCGVQYPIAHGVPLLYPDVVVESSEKPIDAELVATVCQYQGLPLTEAMSAEVAVILGQVCQFPDQLTDREVRVSEVLKSVGTVAEATIAQRRDRQSTVLTGLEPHLELSSPPQGVVYQITHEYLPRTMVAGRRLTGNVCLLNQGTVPIDSQGISPVYLSYHWRSLDREMVIYDGERTALPVILSPGRQITLPMLVQVPNLPGNYRLQICLVHEQVAWLDHDGKELLIQVVTTVDRPDPIELWHQDAIQMSYSDDHQYAIGLVKQELAAIGSTQPHLLEIGGNACPMLQCDFPGQLYNLDIDIQGLQLSHLVNQHKNINMTCICGDVNNIPFSDFSLDGILMFATLHHLPNPIHTLMMLAQKIRPQGFIAVLCEPVGHYHCPPNTDPAGYVDAGFLEALRLGVNEQTFSLDEYAAIFQQSGLVVTKVEVNGTSLKVFLTRPLS
jgi:SAM-dependent methyltransferase/uncharacterized protein YbaR (Trm112 family)